MGGEALEAVQLRGLPAQTLVRASDLATRRRTRSRITDGVVVQARPAATRWIMRITSSV